MKLRQDQDKRNKYLPRKPRPEQYFQDKKRGIFKKVNIKKLLKPVVDKMKIILNSKKQSLGLSSNQIQWSQQEQKLFRNYRDSSELAGQIFHLVEGNIDIISPLFDMSEVRGDYDIYFQIFKFLWTASYRIPYYIGIIFDKSKPEDTFFEQQKFVVGKHLIDLYLNECMIGDLIGSKLSKNNFTSIMKLSIHNDNISNQGVKQLMTLDMPFLCQLSIKNSNITTDSLKIFKKGINKMKYLSVAYNNRFDTNEILKILFCILFHKRTFILDQERQYMIELRKSDYYGLLAKLESSSRQLRLIILQSLNEGQLLILQRFKRNLKNFILVSIQVYRGAS